MLQLITYYVNLRKFVRIFSIHTFVRFALAFAHGCKPTPEAAATVRLQGLVLGMKGEQKPNRRSPGKFPHRPLFFKNPSNSNPKFQSPIFNFSFNNLTFLNAE